ncbi:MAG: polysaccharide pyruvyl transferase family protein, partial [Bdellovibrionales bacterium]|nr:polysaccharide pyruvyl transferase family protein [Bdellovibrionales bacterium]
MKGNHPVITLLGSNSGNNAGDAAILASILDTLGKEMPDAEFLVPTTNPKFIVDSYASKYNVKAINVMPWTGSIRLFGIPVFRAFLKSDIALICDGIIFDVKLFNPLFNFLITLVPLIGFSKVTGCKLGCYSCGIGPLRSFWGRTFARWVINACDFVTMRERDSLALCREIGVTKPIEITGDAAFLNAVSEESKADEISRSLGIPLNQPLFGINVTSYIDQWLDSSQKVGSKDAYLTTLAEAITA